VSGIGGSGCAWNLGSVYTSTPTQDKYIDAALSVVAHEVAEAISDPYIDAWYDLDGLENADKCNFFPAVANLVNKTSKKGPIYNAKIGGTYYLIQTEYDNNLNRCPAVLWLDPDTSTSSMSTTTAKSTVTTLTSAFTTTQTISTSTSVTSTFSTSRGLSTSTSITSTFSTSQGASSFITTQEKSTLTTAVESTALEVITSLDLVFPTLNDIFDTNKDIFFLNKGDRMEPSVCVMILVLCYYVGDHA
jgi:hypothetical protein